MKIGPSPLCSEASSVVLSTRMVCTSVVCIKENCFRTTYSCSLESPPVVTAELYRYHNELGSLPRVGFFYDLAVIPSQTD